MSNQVDYSDRAYDDLPPNLDGISAQDAARTLTDRRWNKDTPVSDGEGYFGAEAVDRSQGYTEMQMARDVKEAVAQELEPSAVAKEIASRKHQLEIEHAGRPLDTHRDYYQQGGPDAGKVMPPNQTVSAEQAASDLTLNRQQEAAEAERLEAAELAKVIEQLRSYDPVQPAPEPPTAEQVAEAEARLRSEHNLPPKAQPEQQQAQADDEVAAALRNPRILAALEHHVSQTNEQAERVREQYNAAVMNNAALTVANIQARNPELRVPIESWPTVLQSLAQSNPQRAQAINAELQATKEYFAHAQQVEAQRHATQMAEQQKQQQFARMQWEHEARQADNAYEIWAAENLSAGVASEIQNEALNMLREDYGLTDAAIARLWNTDMTLRSFAGQRLLADAARYRMAQRGAAAKVHRPVPTVQRPGSPAAIEQPADYNMRQLSAKLDGAKGNDALKAAAALITARRNARR